MQHGKHALTRAVRSLSTRAKVIILGTAVGAAAIGGGLAAMPSSASTPCTDAGNLQNFVQAGTPAVNYYLAGPGTIKLGTAARLRTSAAAAHTVFAHCNANDNSSKVELVITQGSQRLALTSRATVAGSNVTFQPASQYASQTWTWAASGDGFTFQNVKTGLFLRVRNGGPKSQQTVSTGKSATTWLQQEQAPAS